MNTRLHYTLGLVLGVTLLLCAGCRTRYQTYSGPPLSLDNVATLFVREGNVWTVDGATNTPAGKEFLGKNNLTLLPGDHAIQVIVYPVYDPGSNEARTLTITTNTGVLKAGKGYQVGVVIENQETVSGFLHNALTGTKRVSGTFKVWIKEEKHRSDNIKYHPAGPQVALQRDFQTNGEESAKPTPGAVESTLFTIRQPSCWRKAPASSVAQTPAPS